MLIGSDAEEPEATFQGSNWTAPEDTSLDVALIQLDEPIPEQYVAPLALSRLAPADLSRARLLMGGTGITEDNLVARRFVTEQVVDTRAGFLTVDGQGQTGACIADSGSPAIWREGQPTVVGVLMEGDGNCRGIDLYTSTSLFRDWAAQTMGLRHAPFSSDCGKIDLEGRCFDSTALEQAVWCQDGLLQAAECSAGTACGWDTESAGYRCVETAHDTCEGIAQVGACEGTAALHCDSGSLTRRDCGACGTCLVAPTSGVAGCQ